MGVNSPLWGQTPLKLAKGLTAIGANIAGTTAKVIDLAEDRELFSTFIEDLRLKQPANGTVFTKVGCNSCCQPNWVPRTCPSKLCSRWEGYEDRLLRQ